MSTSVAQLAQQHTQIAHCTAHRATHKVLVCPHHASMRWEVLMCVRCCTRGCSMRPAPPLAPEPADEPAPAPGALVLAPPRWLDASSISRPVESKNTSDMSAHATQMDLRPDRKTASSASPPAFSYGFLAVCFRLVVLPSVHTAQPQPPGTTLSASDHCRCDCGCGCAYSSSQNSVSPAAMLLPAAPSLSTDTTPPTFSTLPGASGALR